MPIYRVSYTWTKDEYLKSLRYHHQAQMRPSFALMIDAIVALLGVAGVFVFYIRATSLSWSSRDSIVPAYGLIAFALYWLFVRRPLNRWWLIHNFLKHPLANTLVDGEFSDEHLVSRTNASSSVQEWKLFSKVLEAKEGFLLYGHPQNFFYWLPFSGFESAEAIEEFKRIARSKGLPYIKRAA